jgi:hypothetical protein
VVDLFELLFDFSQWKLGVLKARLRSVDLVLRFPFPKSKMWGAVYNQLNYISSLDINRNF